MKIRETAKKIKDGISKVLKYFRINDDNNLVSLTNVTMIVIIYKISVTPAVNFQDITALAVAVLGYQAKRVVEKIKK